MPWNIDKFKNMSYKPLIGITLDLQEDSVKYSYSKYPWYALRRNYSDAIAKSGGIPVMLPLDQAIISDTLSILDGLVITGGDFDIHPNHYGQEISSSKVNIINKSRTDFEFLLFEQARKLSIPILGICNGMQVINVACGGSLIQDILEQCPSDIKHEQPPPKHVPTHLISVAENTKLYEIVSRIVQHNVNSTHHQAIAKIGNGLRVSATAPDGIIEAIETEDESFVIGIEWHPEYLACGDIDTLLFNNFIGAATNYKHSKK